MNRKIIFWSVGIITLGLIVVLGLFFFYAPDNSVSEDIKNILPFGQGGNNTSDSADADIPKEISATNPDKELPRLFRLSEVPVAGAIGFIRNGSGFVRYADRATGHIYDINPTTLEKIKVANNTIPKIYAAYFKNDASAVIYRFLPNDGDEISTISIALIPPKSTSTTELYSQVTSILRGNINDLAVSNSNKVAYVSDDSNSIVVADFTGANPQTLISNSSFTDWNIGWAGSRVIVTTKPSVGVASNSYLLNSSGGGYTKILGPHTGLQVLANLTNNTIAYVHNNNGVMEFFWGDIGVVGQASFIGTFLDKCVWSKRSGSVIFCGVPENKVGGSELDRWYQGSGHYIDKIWRYETDTDISEIILDSKNDFGLDLDIINPILTPDEDYLVFMNKNDLSLWALKLGE